MRPQHLMTLLALPAVLLAILLTLAAPAAPVHAGGIVSVCDEAHLRAALAGGGTVTFSCSGTITLTAEIVITADTTIDGSGQAVTISGNHAVRVFTMNPGAVFNLNALTVADGSADTGGGILNSFGALTVRNTTFAGNRASASAGGGIATFAGTLTVNNSTFAGNRAIRAGAGTYSDSGRVIVSNSTFVGNSAEDGGGIYNWEGTVTLRNTIVADSPAGGNCTGAITDGGGNLSYPDTTCPGIHRDPKLGPLQDNGGPTWTMALLPGSAAIDAGDDGICAAPPVNNRDQRGVARPQGAHCDIGAYEAELSRAYLPMIIR